MDIGNNPKECDRSDKKVRQEEVTRMCVMLEVPPFVVCEKDHENGVWDFEFDWSSHNGTLIELHESEIMGYKVNQLLESHKIQKPDFKWTESYDQWIEIH